MNSSEKSTANVTETLARDILETYKEVENAINLLAGEDDDGDDDSHMLDVLAEPLPVAYRTLLKDLRFDYVGMKDSNGKFSHHYSSLITNSTPPETKRVRLA